MWRTTIVVMALTSMLSQTDWNQQIQQRSILGNTGMQDYRLGPNDLIDVTVFGVDKFNQSVRISASGQINIPLVGKVQAAGMTGAELEQSVARLLVENKLILDPQVTVFIKEYRSQPVIVMGAVRSPGQYMITQPLRILDVLAMAGGLDLTRAGDFALLQRRSAKTAVETTPGDPPATAGAPASGEPEAIKIDLKALIERSDLSLNLPVQGGDVIQVPEEEMKIFYLIGEVTRPGGYELPRGDEKLLLTQAISWAGGTTKTAKQSGGILVRYDKEGNRVEQPVDCAAIIKGKKPDFPVQAGDVIFIPGSNIKTITLGLLNMVPTTLGGISTSAIIYRRR